VRVYYINIAEKNLHLFFWHYTVKYYKGMFCISLNT